MQRARTSEHKAAAGKKAKGPPSATRRAGQRPAATAAADAALPAPPPKPIPPDPAAAAADALVTRALELWKTGEWSRVLSVRQHAPLAVCGGATRTMCAAAVLHAARTLSCVTGSDGFVAVFAIAAGSAPVRSDIRSTAVAHNASSVDLVQTLTGRHRRSQPSSSAGAKVGLRGTIVRCTPDARDGAGDAALVAEGVAWVWIPSTGVEAMRTENPNGRLDGPVWSRRLQRLVANAEDAWQFHAKGDTQPGGDAAEAASSELVGLVPRLKPSRRDPPKAAVQVPEETILRPTSRRSAPDVVVL